MNPRSTDSLAEFLRQFSDAQTDRDGRNATWLSDAADRLDGLYYGNAPASKVKERYQTATRRLHAVRKAFRSLQAAYERRTAALVEAGQRARARETTIELLQGEIVLLRSQVRELSRQIDEATS